MKLKILSILFAILVLASVLRLIKIDSVPISPDWDEVSLGYNAYSIMQTGKDEYGKKYPVVLRSFDDYKPALYSYLAIPSIKIFGLNVFSVRLPSAIFGVFAVLGTYLLVRELFAREILALISSFLLAISPWHLQFSRVAFEANIGLTLNIFAALFFIKGLKRPIFLVLSAVLMGLNLYVYQSEKVFTPLLLLILLATFGKEFRKISRRFLIASVLAGFLISLPMLSYLVTNKNSLERAKGVSIFSQPYPKSEAQKALDNKGDGLGFIFDNRRVFFAKEIISGYLSHFDLNWLFIRGDIARHHAPNMGLLYLLELPFLFLGIYVLFSGKNERDKKIRNLILLWVLITPIAASVTSGVPHAIRTLNFLPTFQILTALGILYSLPFLKNYKLYIPIFILAVLNFSYFLDQYFVQQNVFHAKEWQYGYSQIIETTNFDKYNKIVVSNEGIMDQSYIFFLFYLKYPPTMYQTQSELASGGFRENHKFGKFEFRPIIWEKEKRSKDILYIGRPTDFSPDRETLGIIYYPDKTEAMKLVQ